LVRRDVLSELLECASAAVDETSQPEIARVEASEVASLREKMADR
jgi:hypothetical protein